MSIVARDPHFSWSCPLGEEEKITRNLSANNTHIHHIHTPQTMAPVTTKQIERRLVNLWKTLTRSTKKQRVSVYAKDFVFVTSSNATSRRRSIMALHQAQAQGHHSQYQHQHQSLISDSASASPVSYSGSTNIRGYHTF